MAGSEQRRSILRFSDSQIKSLAACIGANLGSQLTLMDLAGLFKMSPRQFFRLFCNTFGNTPGHCISAWIGPRNYYQPYHRRPTRAASLFH
jgi:transcriptional regulator GlxA family with amidase domain